MLEFLRMVHTSQSLCKICQKSQSYWDSWNASIPNGAGYKYTIKLFLKSSKCFVKHQCWGTLTLVCQLHYSVMHQNGLGYSLLQEHQTCSCLWSTRPKSSWEKLCSGWKRNTSHHCRLWKIWLIHLYCARQNHNPLVPITFIWLQSTYRECFWDSKIWWYLRVQGSVPSWCTF